MVLKAVSPVVFLLLLFSNFDMYAQRSKAEGVDSIINAYVERQKAKGNSFSFNLVIAKDGDIIYKRLNGYADWIKKDTLNESTLFNLASVSKPFIATAIMMLKERNQLSLEDTVTKYFPELPYNNVTIRNMLTHTSGLPDFINMVGAYGDTTKIITNKEVIALLAMRRDSLRFQPYEKWEYSNTGYVLLASIIEKVSRMPVNDFLTENIFKPLKMNRTTLYLRLFQPERKLINYAFGYLSDNDKPVLPENTPGYWYVRAMDGVTGPGMIYSSAEDLLKFDNALYTNALLKEETLKEMFKPVLLNNQTTAKYGLGWFLATKPQMGPLMYHTGNWPGYGAFFGHYPDKKVSIILLINKEGFLLKEILLPIEKVLAEE